MLVTPLGKKTLPISHRFKPDWSLFLKHAPCCPDLRCWHLETSFDSRSSILDSLLARALTDHIRQISALGSQKGDEIKIIGQF